MNKQYTLLERFEGFEQDLQIVRYFKFTVVTINQQSL